MSESGADWLTGTADQEDATDGILDGVKVLKKPDGGIVYLLGTAHTSATSAAHAAALVDAVRPDSVLLELCSGRAHMAEHSRPLSSPSSSSPAPGHMELAGSISSILADWTEGVQMQYAAFERVVGESAGGEFAAAAAEAKRHGAVVVLGDRDVDLTLRRLKRLTPLFELAQNLVGWEDGEWVRGQAELRMEEADRLSATSAALRVAAAAEPVDAAEVRRLGAQLERQAEAHVRLAAPGFCDAVLYETLRRFWCFELIGAEQRARLRRALGELHRLELGDMALTPTLRRVLLDERDVVLAHALKGCAGQRVVGVVGKGHVDGIGRLWEEDTAALLPAALEEPPLPLGRRALAGAVAVALPLGAWRSRRLRLGLGAAALGLAGSGAWLVSALQRRVAFYERSQQETRD